MSNQVEVIFNEPNNSETLTITLRRGAEVVTCREVFYWDDAVASFCFDEWMELAVAGEPQYTAG